MNNKIIHIYKSRKVILELMTELGYDTKEYDGFSTNEVDAMMSTDQLDMLLKDSFTPNTKHKTYINYFLKGNLTPTTLNPIIEDLFHLSDTLTKDDCLVIIYDGEPSETLLNTLDHIYKHDKIFIVVLNIKRLQFNIHQHVLVPNISILTENEKTELFKKYHITHPNQMPEISRFDPLALAVCLRPGQVCKLIRSSPTSIESEYYRLCC